MLMRELLDSACCRHLPKYLAKLEGLSQKAGFTQSSQTKTGVLLRTLAASKPGGSFLELGTGTGISAAWILDGMDAQSKLVSVDNDDKVQGIAVEVIDDNRVRFVQSTAKVFMEKQKAESFDLIFADAWEGKYEHLDLCLSLLRPGGFYIVDDMLPQPNWPEGQEFKVPLIQETFAKLQGFHIWPMSYGTGYIIAVKQ